MSSKSAPSRAASEEERSRAQDAALETTAILRDDAEVVFKPDVCLRELVYNVFGVFALPWMVARHGRVGAMNRQFLGCSYTFALQFIWAVFFFGLNILHGIYANSSGYVVTTFEIVIIDLLYFLRCLTIGIKYGHYSRRELKELDIIPITGPAIEEKLVLAGWLHPSSHLLYREMERAVFRKALNMCSHKIVYADRCTRDAMLWTIKECVPAYLKYELDVDIEAQMKEEEAERVAEEAEAAAQRAGAAATAQRPAGAASETRVVIVKTPEDIAKLGLSPEAAAAALAAIQQALQPQQAQASDTEPTSNPLSATPTPPVLLASDDTGSTRVEPSIPSTTRATPGAKDWLGHEQPNEDAAGPEDTSLEARAVRTIIEWMDSEDARYMQIDIAETMERANAAMRGSNADDPREDSVITASSRSMLPGGDNVEARGAAGAAAVRGGGPMRLQSSSKRIPPPAPPPRTPLALPQGSSTQVSSVKLPYIPGKLFAWSVVYAAYHGKFGTTTFSIARVISFIFAFIPVIVRGAYGSRQPFGTTWPSWLVEIATIFMTLSNFGVTINYVMVAPIDFTRRLKAMKVLDQCLDAQSPVATDFAIPAGASGGDTGAKIGDPRGSPAADGDSSVMKFINYATIPMSKVAVERAQHLEQVDADDSVIVRQSSGATQVVAKRARSGTQSPAWAPRSRLSSFSEGVNRGTTAPANRTSAAGAALATAASNTARMLVGVGPGESMQTVGSPLPSPTVDRVPTDLSAVASTAEDGGRISGWLVKRSFRGQHAAAQGGFFAALAAKSWKRRYFIGDSKAGTISYHPSPGALPINTLRITRTTRAYPTRMHYRSHEFAIQFDDVPDGQGAENEGSILYVCAPSDAVRDTWIAFVTGTVKRCHDLALAKEAYEARIAQEAAEAAAALEAERMAQQAVAEVEERERQIQDEADRDVLLTIERDHSAHGDHAVDVASPVVAHRSRVRDSILARHRLLALAPFTQEKDAKISVPVLYGENLVAWFASRQLIMDFGESYRLRIELYCACFAIMVILAIILLFMNFTRAGGGEEIQVIMLAMVAVGQISFSGALALSIVTGSQLNDQATYHRFRLSRIETLICDFLVAGTTRAVRGGRPVPWKAAHDSPVQRQLRLTRQVASSIGQALVTETAVVPARVLFMPANMALLSTFWSLSISGTLSAIRALGI